MRKSNKDLIQKRYWEDEERIAELLNMLLFGSTEVVLADGIGSADKELAAETGQSGARFAFTRLADVAKLVSIGENQVFLYLENQSYIDYAMAERNLALEAACYHEQRRRIRSRHRERKDWGDKSEFLGGFVKEDRLLPALCIVLYYGEDEWDAEKSLQGLLAMDDRQGMKKYVNDSRVLVLDVKRLEGTECLQTDLRETFTFIRYASDKKRLKEYIEENEKAFRLIREDALEFVAYTTGTKALLKMKEKIRTEEGGYDVCKAIQGMIEDGKREGRREGRKEGRREGRKEGILLMKRAIKLQADGKNVEEIAETLRISRKQAEMMLS